MTRSVQGEVRWVFEQPDPVKEDPGHGMGFGLHDLYRFLPTQIILRVREFPVLPKQA